jgi:hypothetical protein
MSKKFWPILRFVARIAVLVGLLVTVVMSDLARSRHLRGLQREHDRLIIQLHELQREHDRLIEQIQQLQPHTTNQTL